MTPETIKSISTVISIINICLITYGSVGMFKWIKNSISSYQIKDGRYCYGCNSEIVSDDDYFKNWAINWANGGINNTNPNPFKPKSELKLCQKCERDQKLFSITNSGINWVKIRKFIISNDQKIDFSLIGIFVLLLIVTVILMISKITIPLFSLFYNIYLLIYWSYFIFKSKLYIKI